MYNSDDSSRRPYVWFDGKTIGLQFFSLYLYRAYVYRSYYGERIIILHGPLVHRSAWNTCAYFIVIYLRYIIIICIILCASRDTSHMARANRAAAVVSEYCREKYHIMTINTRTMRNLRGRCIIMHAPIYNIISVYVYTLYTCIIIS